MIKELKVFNKNMEILEKVSNIVKKINSELIYDKKYIETEKTFNMKESFQCFYEKGIPVQVILIDSVYRKDENYYPKEFLQKHFAFKEKIF